MKKKPRHCSPLTEETPAAAQTTLAVKLSTLDAVFGQAAALQRSKPWGIYFPSDFDPSETPGGGTGGNGGLDGGTDGGLDGGSLPF